jgi:MFS family permease
MASAISFVLFTFGTGIGLSITSPYPPESVSAPTFAIVLSLWIVVVTIVSFLAGGYFTGLLIRRYATGEHEREMRDGMHGALTWALGVILGASLTALTVAGAAKTGTEATVQAPTGAPTAYLPMFSCDPIILRLLRRPKRRAGAMRSHVSLCAILRVMSPPMIVPISAGW